MLYSISQKSVRTDRLIQKTQAIFNTRRRKNEIPTQQLSVFNSNIKWETNVKYLGMHLDKRLTYQSHIEYIIEKVHKVTRILYPMINRKSSLKINNKLLLYKVVIRPIATYAVPVLRNIALISHIKKLQIMQNKILKIDTGRLLANQH